MPTIYEEDDYKSDNPARYLMNQIMDLRNYLSQYDIKKIKTLMNTEYTQERDQIIDQFNIDFKNLPKSDPIRINTLILMSELGITPTKTVEQPVSIEEEINKMDSKLQSDLEALQV